MELKEAKNALKKNMKKNAFITGALILGVAGIICRALGVVLRIPLTNIVGNFGMGLYQMVFPLYALLLIVSSAGFPVAISKLVARERVSGNIKECRRILFNAVILLGVIGAIVSALFVVFSGAIARLQGNGDVGIIYVAIAPSVFLVCVIAGFRGYFQGLTNMIPTAISQIIEQLVKIGVGLTLAVILIHKSVEMAVFGAILAVTISEVVALVFLICVYIFTCKNVDVSAQELNSKQTKQSTEPSSSEQGVQSTDPSSNEQGSQSAKVSNDWKTQNSNKNIGSARHGFFSLFDKKIMWQVLRQSIPITLMASVFPLILVFDSLVIINLLKSAGESSEVATELFGIQSGAVHTLINLPAVLGVALGTAVVPTVTSLFKQKKFDEMRAKCVTSVKIILVLTMFFVGFYLAFSGRIIDLLYHSAFAKNEEHFRIAKNLLRIESIMIIFMGLTSVFSAVLQALDHAKLPLIALGVGGLLKVAFELIFITSKMGIYAVSVSNVICFGVACTLNTVFCLRNIKIGKDVAKCTPKFFFMVSAFAMSLIALWLVIPTNRFFVILAGMVALVTYSIIIFFLKLFDKGELRVIK